MPSARYNLKSEPDPRLIMLVFRVNKHKFQYSTGEKVPEKFWDKGNCRVRATKQFPAHRAVNDLLSAMAHTCDNAYRDYLAKNTQPTWEGLRDHLKEELDKAMMKAKEPETVGLFDFIERYITGKEESKTISQGTTKVLRTWQNILTEYDKRLTYESINPAFKEKFVNWLYTEKNHSIFRPMRREVIRIVIDSTRSIHALP